MLNKIIKTVLSVVATIVTIIALAGMSTSSAFYLYEPDIPECLKK